MASTNFDMRLYGCVWGTLTDKFKKPGLCDADVMRL